MSTQILPSRLVARASLSGLLAGLLLLSDLMAPVAQEPPSPRQQPALDETTIPLPRPRPEPARAGAVSGAETVSETGRETDAETETGTTTEEATQSEPLEPVRVRVYQAACPAVLTGKVEARTLPPLAEGECGERSPLAITGLLVNGRMVPVSSQIVLNCAMASALPEWAADIDGYLAARENTRLARLLVGTSYSCRNRNNAFEGPLSEHGLANALDVVGFELEDGRMMGLPGGWMPPESPSGRLLRFAHAAACAAFTTTLGPEANAAHADHLHLDLSCRGPGCTARMCE